MKYLFILLISGSLLPLQENLISALRDDTFWPDRDNKYYQRFKEETTVQELKIFMKDSSYHLRAYAFAALLERKIPGLEQILSEHLTDTVYIPTIIMGDMIIYQRLIDVMFSNMQEANYLLTERAYHEYQKLIPPATKPPEIEVDIEISEEDLWE